MKPGKTDDRSMLLDERDLRNALGRFVTGVTIATTINEHGEPVGLTANSFNSVSLDPPLILWSLAQRSRALPAFRAARFFAINVLSAEQIELSKRFAAPITDRFADVAWSPGDNGAPLLSKSLATFECNVDQTIAAGDHVVIIGRVTAFGQSEREPLVWFSGKYATTAAEDA